jgi:Uncharacterized protein conserved in bacteria
MSELKFDSKLMMFRILVDADAVPVKQEVFRVALRYGINVVMVANSPINIQQEDWLETVVVSGRFDAADDWIVEHVQKNDIVVTGDIPLAARCLKKAARVLDYRGRILTENSIGNLLATRDLMAHLRDIGVNTGGPKVFEKKDRSRFLQSLDTVVQSILNGK